MAIVKKIQVLLTAGTQQLRTALRKGQAEVKGFRTEVVKGIRSVVGFGTAAAAVYTAVRAFRAAYDAAEGFNRAMAESTAIMGDLSAQTTILMRLRARAAAYGTAFTESETAKAYYYLASAGMDAKQSMAALGQVTRFAQAGMFDLSRATDLATDAQSALGLRAKDAQQNLENLTRVTDVLVKANTLANATTEQFSEAITNKAGAAARMVGMEIEELVAILAAYADQGTKASEAGTRVAIVLRDLQTKALKNAAAFRKHGVTVYDASGELRNMADILADLETRLAGASDAVKKATLLQMGFSDKSVAALQSLIGMSEQVRDYEAKLRDAAGTTREVAEKMLPQFTKAMRKLWWMVKTFVGIPLAATLNTIGAAINAILAPLEMMAKCLAGINVQGRELVSWSKSLGSLGALVAPMPKIQFENLTKAPEKIAKTTEALRQFQAVQGSIARENWLARMSMEAGKVLDTFLMLEAKWKDMAETQRQLAKGIKEWEADLERLQEMGAAPFMIEAIRKAIEEYKYWEKINKKREQVDAEQKRIKSFAEGLTRQFDTVGEAVKRIRDIHKAFREGLITEEVRRKALEDVRKQFVVEPETFELPRAGWKGRGTAEAFAATLDKEMIHVEKQQLLALDRIEREIKRGFRNAMQLKPSSN